MSQHHSDDANTINKRYKMVKEVSLIMHEVPFRSNLDVFKVIKAIEYNMALPDPNDWAVFASYIEEIRDIYDYFKEHVYPIIETNTNVKIETV